MSLRIAGMGWVTPLGSGVEEVWQRLLNGETAVAEPLSSPLGRDYPVFRVPASALAKAPAHPRLRRSSAISRFAAIAGVEALANANLKLDADTAKQTALIFAISNGGVIYTKRFYHDIVESGAQAASPLLFPETVFNAPASHLAAMLEITGASYTLVGDGAVGTLALKMAEDLMADDAFDYCLVVGAEETDWLLCDAYRKWRLLRAAPPIEPFQEPPRGTILSEGAGAVLISREGPIRIEKISGGTNFQKQRQASDAVEKVFAELCAAPPNLVAASANGTFIDGAEQKAIQKHSPNARVYTVKAALGESVGASSLWQTIAAAQALITQKLPGATAVVQDALISSCGLNQQVAGLRITASPRSSRGVLPLQQAAPSVASHPAMRRLFLLVLGLFCASTWAFGQVGTEKQPMEITATGDTNYQDGLAIAHGNVAIHAGDADIYADQATYNPKTHDIIAEGHVRIYRTAGTFIGERAIYNTQTKEIKAVDIKTDKQPYLVAGQKVTSISEGAFMISKGTFTTHDSDKPDFRLVAKTMRIYQEDRVIFQNVTFYVKNVPLFWWPYLYQSLDESFSYMISPAYLSSWGPSILGRVTMPITEDIKGVFRLDYRYRRGVAVGFDPDIRFGADKQSWARIRTYFLKDDNPEINQTSIPRPPISEGRYRVSLQSRTKITEDITAIANMTKLSDEFVLQDFFQGEFQLNPQPDNIIAVTKWHPAYTLTALGRFQANEFFDTTERLPEVAFDITRQPLFGGPIFYEGETSLAELRRSFAEGSAFHDYSSLRLDTFHQFTFPTNWFGWLSVVPRVGFRATYYDKTRDLGKTIIPPSDNPFIPDFLNINPADPVVFAGNKLRTVFNGGVEASFKVTKTWDGAQSNAIGLDGLKHVIQPFMNFSWVSTSANDPASILQFDRYQPSTQLRPIDFPQFTTIDSIDNWTILRLGVRNRLLTRRDDSTVSWMDIETYLDVNFDNPFDKTQYSNLFNRLSFTPLPWMSFGISSQVPVFEKGFTEVNTNVSIQPIPNLQISFAHRYLNANPFFDNSSLYVLGGYYRINDNWGFGVQEQYEGTTGVLEQQRYSIYRDLTSWVASVGAIIRDNGGVKEYGVLLTFTLKALPRFSFDLNFDPAGAEQTQ